jgi:hypothetical protein
MEAELDCALELLHTSVAPALTSLAALARADAHAELLDARVGEGGQQLLQLLRPRLQPRVWRQLHQQRTSLTHLGDLIPKFPC